jgi:Flp pilus assembly protein TadG
VGVPIAPGPTGARGVDIDLGTEMTIGKQADKLARWLATRGASFYRGKSGAVAIIFALAILPLMMLVGAAVDYSRAASAASRLGEAADNGALAAAQAATRAIAAGNANWNAAGVAAGRNAFMANAVGLTTAAAPTIVVTQAGVGATAQISVAGQIPATVMSLVGVPNLTFTKTAAATTEATQTTGTSQTATPTYGNVSLVLDVSPSMAIAATTSGMSSLESLTLAQTGTACAFACHDIDSGSAGNYSIARANNIPLRIDVVTSAAQAFANFVTTATTTPGQYTVGLYTLSSSLKTLVAPTANLSAVSTAIGNLDFDAMSTLFSSLPAPAAANVASGDSLTHYADTDFGASLATLNTLVPASGSGTSASSPKQLVILITDGLYDTGVPYNSSISATFTYPSATNFSTGNNEGKYTRPFNPTLCNTLKQIGAQVAVIYVTYVPEPSDPNGFYQALVETNAPPAALVSQLQACASSPSLFYQATDLATITADMNAFLANAFGAIGPLRLSQ